MSKNICRMLADISQHLQEEFHNCLKAKKREAIFFLDCDAFQVLLAENEKAANNVQVAVQQMIDDVISNNKTIRHPYATFNLYYGRLD
ncbi:hypothetical protein [Vibrio phage BONAISHI]|nr:hypothetical protein [Vibrio phage BONAISHI]